MWPDAITMYRPPIPPWLIGALIGAAALAALMVYMHAARHERRWRAIMLVALRLTALAAVAWVLAGPSALRSVGLGERPLRVMFLADTSASMTERDVPQLDANNADSMSRWDALARHWLDPAFLRTLSEQADFQLRSFDETLNPLDLDRPPSLTPAGQSTRIARTLRQVAHRDANDVIVLLSDGRDTHDAIDESLLSDLARRGMTIFTVPVGSPHTGEHLALHAWPEADVLYDGQSTTIHATVTQHGHDDETLRVELRRDGTLVDEQPVTFDGDATQRIAFEVTPPGPSAGARSVAVRDYELRIERPTNAQAETEHARQHVFVQVSRERIRVALIEGEPYWDTRFLGRVLRRDPRIALGALYAFGEARRMHVTDENAQPLDAEPIERATLDHFDVVILGRRIERFFPGDRAQMLRDYVQERGGALVLARGRPFDLDTTAGQAAMAAIEPIAPVTWGEGAVRQLRLELTPAGRDTPLIAVDDNSADSDALLTRLPGMIAATRIEQTHAASVVLLNQTPIDARTPAMAALVHGRAGRGHVLAVLTEGLWRWALLPDGTDEDGSGDDAISRGVYETFWSRAMRWLAAGGEFLPGQDVALTLERTIVEPEEPVNVTVATRFVPRDFEPELTRIGPDGDRHRITLERDRESPTRWRATLAPRAPGIHRLELRSPAHPALIAPDTPIVSHLVVRRRSIEQLDTAARPETLEALAAATGGEMLAMDQRQRLLEHLAGRQAARTREREPTYDFARWPAFVIIALCLGLEWLGRRAAGWS